jgi:hypothetical protein
MECRIDGDLPALPAVPDGIDVRAGTPELARRVWEADHEAFRDHWGGSDPSEAAFRRWIDSPEFDPELQVLAFDGDEVAGAVLNAIYPEENEALGRVVSTVELARYARPGTDLHDVSDDARTVWRGALSRRRRLDKARALLLPAEGRGLWRSAFRFGRPAGRSNADADAG